MKVTVIGLGLIGGSMALDLRKSGLATTLFGIDRHEANAAKALELGLVDKIISENDFLGQSDLVIVSIPVNATCALLPFMLDAIGPNTVIIDTGSTKNLICKSVNGHIKRNQFVAAHPIAGTEFSGPSAAFSGLFDGKTNI